jgi:hypothetical protein
MVTSYVVLIVISQCSVRVPSFHGRSFRDIHIFDLLELEPHAFHTLRGQVSSTKAEVCKLNMTFGIDQEILRFQVTVDVAKLVQGIDRREHFRDVEPRMIEMQDTGIV